MVSRDTVMHGTYYNKQYYQAVARRRQGAVPPSPAVRTNVPPFENGSKRKLYYL